MLNFLTANTFDAAPWMMGLGAIGMILIFVIAIIAVLLKGLALWHAAKRDEKWWFIALLIINTAGILELVYLIFFVKKWPKIYGGNKDTVSTPTSTPV